MQMPFWQFELQQFGLSLHGVPGPTHASQRFW
jgi:hypothetical protein